MALLDRRARSLELRTSCDMPLQISTQISMEAKGAMGKLKKDNPG